MKRFLCKFLTAFAFGVCIAEFVTGSQFASSIQIDDVSSPTANIRSKLDDIYYEAMLNGYSVVRPPIYIFSMELDTPAKKISPAVKLDRSDIILNNRSSVLFSNSDKSLQGYYILSANGNKVIGFSLFEILGYNFGNTIYNDLRQGGFVLNPNLLPGIIASCKINIFEKNHSNSYIERLVLADVPISNGETMTEVIAETYYPINFDDAMKSLLLQWATNNISLNQENNAPQPPAY